MKESQADPAVLLVRVDDPTACAFVLVSQAQVMLASGEWKRAEGSE